MATFSANLLRNNFGLEVANFDNTTSSSLIDVQKRSYKRFLDDKSYSTASIGYIFKTIFPIHDTFGNATVDFTSYRLSYSKLTPDECRKKSLTYAVDIYVNVSLTTYEVNQEDGTSEIKNIKEQEVFLCSMPLMTENATFIINGFERVVVSQIHRSPGAFFARDIVDNTPVYSASVIPYRGSWLNIYFDSKNVLNFKIDKKKRMNIYYLLRSLKMDNKDILNFFYEPLTLSYNKEEDYWNINLQNDSLKGQYSPYDIYDENNDLVVSSTQMINAKIAKKIKAVKKLYIKNESLVNSNLFNNIDENGLILPILSSLTQDNVEEIISKEIKELTIVNKINNNYTDFVLNSLLSHDDITYKDALIAIFKVLNPGELLSFEDAEKAMHRMFFSSDYYNLFSVGRRKMNEALEIEDEDESCTTLRKEDILLTIKKLIKLKKNNSETDDIDHLGHRRIRSVGELLENQFRSGLLKVCRVVKEKLSSPANISNLTPSDVIIGTPVAKAIKDFCLNSMLSQFMDHTNPLSELAHKRRISSLGVGGLSRERAGVEVRDVHPTHYGRICPIETPEGQNIGLINSLATYSVVNDHGFIESPYLKVSNGKLTNEVVFLDATEEYKHFICQFDRNIALTKQISADVVNARKGGDFIVTKSSNIDYIDVSPRQTISVVTSLIPFLENDDAKRALMGSNMQRQAVPLIAPESPLIGTGMESVVARDSGAIITAKRAGKVIFMESSRIVIRVSKDDTEDLLSSETDSYKLRKFDRSNSTTCINQIPIVKTGDFVLQGQTIADGPATQRGEIALGKNLTVAFLPFDGYNFEDSIAISEKVTKEDSFTSIHIDSYEATVRDTKLGVEETTRDIPNISGENVTYLDESGIIHVGTKVSAGDILVGKITPKNEVPITPEEKLLRAIFGHKSTEVKDSSLRVSPGVSGTVIGVNILTRRGIEKDSRAKKIEQEEIIKCKEEHSYQTNALKSFFSNEMSDVLIDQEVSYLESGGKSTNVILDQRSAHEMTFDRKISLVIKDDSVQRKIQALKEQYDKSYQELEKDYKLHIERIIDGDDLQAGVLKIIRISIAIKSKLQPGDKMAGRHGNKGVISKIVPIEDMPFMENGEPVDIVLNPLGVPSRMNIGQILETNLGLVSQSLGKAIDKEYKTRKSISDVRTLLNNVLTDNNLKGRLDQLKDEEIFELINRFKDGYPFKTPAFEGPKVGVIEDMLTNLGVNKSGQMYLRDGKTGEKFDRPVTVGCIYMLKLHHLVDDKIHARSTGPYSLVTKQPLGGKSHFGGQRLGEMECWALEAYGAAYTLQEMLTVKSDDVEGRNNAYEAIVKGQTVYECSIPESFNVLLKELRSLCFNVTMSNEDDSSDSNSN